MGKIENADAYSKVGNPTCGDILEIYLKVKDKKVTNIGFETLGCPAAISTSSVVTDLAKGKTILQAKKITNTQVAKKLGGLPKIKMHCSHLAVEALQKAIANYEKNHKKK